jgi:methylthioribulose 1-phosphate dehydratase/enolase-phosphatase E1
MHAQMATLLDPTEQADRLRITHLEMLKGVGNHAYDDVLEVPIIDNRPSEDQLADQLRAAVRKFPKANAILVRRHGLYCWGDSWEQAKTQCESFDYLFQSAVQMKQMGLDPGVIPQTGSYRVDGGSRPAKRARTEGFHGMTAANNQDDLESNVVPLLPRDAKVLLLDIEGCTTSIAFVKDELFPYVRAHLDDFVANHVQGEDYEKLCEALASEVETAGGTVTPEMGKQADSLVYYLMDRDVKSAALKKLQGRMWKTGYEAGEIKGHIYADFKPTLDWMKANGVDVYIYSSGSIQAQKFLFGNSEAGDLLPYIKGHFDIPSAGNKKVASSYTNIAKAIEVDPAAIVFVSDSEDELKAAREAGLEHAIMSIRPGNAKLTDYGKRLPTVYSLLQLSGV